MSGIIVVNFNEGDSLIGVDIIDGMNEIMLFIDVGKVVCFKEVEEFEVLDENGNFVFDENGNLEICFKGVCLMG